MSQPEDDPMIAEIRRSHQRRSQWLRDGDGSITRRLAQIGVLGWITVIPMLIGVFTGHWLDARYHSGIFWTAPLLMLGAALGCWSAWRWIESA